MKKLLEEEELNSKVVQHSSNEKVKIIKNVSRKVKLESVFKMVYYGEFSSKPEHK